MLDGRPYEPERDDGNDDEYRTDHMDACFRGRNYGLGDGSGYILIETMNGPLLPVLGSQAFLSLVCDKDGDPDERLELIRLLNKHVTHIAHTYPIETPPPINGGTRQAA